MRFSLVSALSAGKDSFRRKTLSYRALHGVPDFLKIKPDIRPFHLLDILPDTKIVFAAIFRNFRKAVLLINIRRGNILRTFYSYGSAAYAVNSCFTDFLSVLERLHIHGTRVAQFAVIFRVEHNFGRNGRKALAQNGVGHVSLAGFRKRAVKSHPKAVRLRVLGFEDICGALRPYGVGAGGSAAYAVKLF